MTRRRNKRMDYEEKSDRAVYTTNKSNDVRKEIIHHFSQSRVLFLTETPTHFGFLSSESAFRSSSSKAFLVFSGSNDRSRSTTAESRTPDSSRSIERRNTRRIYRQDVCLEWRLRSIPKMLAPATRILRWKPARFSTDKLVRSAIFRKFLVQVSFIIHNKIKYATNVARKPRDGSLQ